MEVATEMCIRDRLNIDKVLITKITDSLPLIESALYKMKCKDEDLSLIHICY